MKSLHFRTNAEYYRWVAETWPHLIAGLPPIERKSITDLETAALPLTRSEESFANDSYYYPRKPFPLRRRRGR